MKKTILLLILCVFFTKNYAGYPQLLMLLAWENGSEYILSHVKDPFVKQIVNHNIPLLIEEDINRAVNGTIMIIGNTKGIKIADTSFVRKSKGFLLRSSNDIKKKKLASAASTLIDYADYIMDYLDSKKKPIKAETKDEDIIGGEFIYSSSRDASMQQDIIDSIKHLDDNMYFSRFEDYSFFGNYDNCAYVPGLENVDDSYEGYTDQVKFSFGKLVSTVRIDKLPQIVKGITAEELIGNKELSKAMLGIVEESWKLHDAEALTAKIKNYKNFKAAYFYVRAVADGGYYYWTTLCVGFSGDKFYAFQYQPVRSNEYKHSLNFEQLMNNLVFIGAQI